MVARVGAASKTTAATTRKRNAAAIKAASTSGKTKPAPKARRSWPGRPSLYTPAMCERICQHVANGGTIGQLDDEPSMPAAVTAWKWIQSDPDFYQRYLAATELRLARWSEEIVEIADLSNGKTVLVDKLRIDTRLRLMSKLARPAGSGNGNGAESSMAALSAMSWEEKIDHACDLFRTLGILVEDDKGDR